jgi:putative peptidoglycan lipid II flippase
MRARGALYDHQPVEPPSRRTGRAAALVASGILFSRITGLIRQILFAHFFGVQTDAADAFTASYRIPNFLQNLFGEGALSASFIPVYASLLARGERENATRVAGAVGAILSLLTSVIVLVGVLFTPLVITLIAPGFTGAKRDLTILLVRIGFPGVGLLVLSSWCLGILNSHRRFLLSYSAPVLSNAAMIATLVIWGPGMQQQLPRLAIYLAWGSTVGSLLQFLVQVPTILKLVPDLRFTLDWSDHVRTMIRNFGPVFISRGVVQISAFVDSLLASLLPTGAMTGLANAQLLYTLPVSLFGMSVSAAELPAMSGAVGLDAPDLLRDRLNNGLRQIAFFVVPSSMAFLALGDVIAAALLQTGAFRHEDALFVWAILAGSSVGLLASTLGRLYSSTYYALRDTRTPLRYAVLRVILTTVLGYLCAVVLPPYLPIPRLWATAGLTASAGVSGWLEFVLLRRTLNKRLGPTGLPGSLTTRLWIAAAVGAAVAWAIKIAAPADHPVITGVLVLVPYGLVYLGMTLMLQVPEAKNAVGRFVDRRSSIVDRR